MFTGGGAHDPCTPYCSSYLLVDIKTGRDFRFGVTENISDVLQKFHMKLSGCRRNWMVHCFVCGFASRKDASDFRKVWKLHVEIIQDSYDIDCDAVLRVAASELYHHWNRYERELTVTLSQCICICNDFLLVCCLIDIDLIGWPCNTDDSTRPIILLMSLGVTRNIAQCL